jgi:hypothetical protein
MYSIKKDSAWKGGLDTRPKLQGFHKSAPTIHLNMLDKDE